MTLTTRMIIHDNESHHETYLIQQCNCCEMYVVTCKSENVIAEKTSHATLESALARALLIARETFFTDDFLERER